MSVGYEDDPDVRLMLAVKAEDPGAFETLVERHSAFLLNFIFKFTGSKATAEDLAQEVFFKVYRAAPHYQPTAKFRTWLLTIASNLCLNRKRWEKNHFAHSLDAPRSEGGSQTLGDDVADDGERPGDSMERMEMRRAVRAAIADLPENQRVAVILARYHELSYIEIGEMLGLSIMAVKSLLNRAKENLKDKLVRELKLPAEAQTEPGL